MEHEVAIIGGTGALGYGLALRLGRGGVSVTIGSRDADRAQQAVKKLREQVPAGEFEAARNSDAVKSVSELIFLCVPFRNQSETLTNLRSSFKSDQIVIDTTVPLAAAISGKATRTLGVWQGSAAQQVAEMVPDGVAVVSGLHTVSAALLNAETPLDQDVLICGDSHTAKERAAKVIELIPNLRCVDCGRLEQSRITESLAALLIGVNVRYRVHSGVRVTDLVGNLWKI